MPVLHILPDGGASGWDLFLAPAVEDFSFAALVRTMHHREETHIKTGARPVTAHHTPLSSCHFLPFCWPNLTSFLWGRKGHFLPVDRQTDRESTHLPSFHSLFTSPLICFASFTILTSPFGTLPLHSLRALQGGGGWWRTERDYDRHGMKVLRRKKEESGKKIKLLLSELARSVCTRRAICRGRRGEAI